jgi:DNA-binding Lrp family transcriptional regulator
MKSDPVTKQVLSELELNSRLNISDVADRLNLREHVVRRAAQRLLDQGMIRPVLSVDLTKIGLREFSVCFALTASTPSAEFEFITALSRLDRVTRIVELGGQYDYTVVFAAHELSELNQLLERACQKADVWLERKDVAVNISITDFGVRALHHQESSPAPITVGGQPDNLKLSDIDHKLLKTVCTSPGESTSFYSREMKCPFSTVSYHLDSLKERGIIAAFRYIVTGGVHLHAFKVYIALRRPMAEAGRQLYEYCKNNKACNYLLACAGNWDFEIGMRIEDADFTGDHIKALKGILSPCAPVIMVIPGFRLLKYAKYPFATNPTKE